MNCILENKISSCSRLKHIQRDYYRDIQVICANWTLCVLSDISWWRHQMEAFSALLALYARHSPVNSPHKSQWRGDLMFFLIWVWINGSVNSREAGDLRRHRAHYDVIVMLCSMRSLNNINTRPLCWNTSMSSFNCLNLSDGIDKYI